MTRTCGWIVGALCLLAVGAGEARAQGSVFRGLATASIGSTFGGDVDGASITPGVSVAVIEESGWGAEMDLAFAGDTGPAGAGADLTMLLVNLHWMSPRGDLRPYATGGAGAVAVHGCLSACSRVTTTWEAGLDVGGGLLYRFTDIIGFRGDARYTWLPGDTHGPEKFGFWRASVGVTFQWAIIP